MRMTYESMMLFAETWIAAWNRRDIDAVLAHFADEAQFVSPVAHKLIGHSVLRNRREIESYWRTALARISEGANKSWCSPAGARPVRVRP
jgi:hypothetical protein